MPLAEMGLIRLPVYLQINLHWPGMKVSYIISILVETSGMHRLWI
jgi:hypothetical protein